MVLVLIFSLYWLFSKQVPAAYTIILISIINIYLFYKLKRINIFLNYISGASLFLILLVSILIYNKISLSDFILQLFYFLNLSVQADMRIIL